tara:strand:+ start:2504 stop:2704 length:201 start_codon:yes stop_codon:yes gene_type:complete
MTRTEAIKELEQGRKITHRYFLDNEFLKMVDNQIVFEDGNQVNPNEFWKLRGSEVWEDGYSYYTKK